ncbi:MAG: FIG00485738: hypothetical protein [uncultured Corynebacteriales bacterium]|uniref:Right handed beta helix domain-containing protein n=1 Tax=uncultured Mycobacteriales bacterium TaxID=581187 RepID=A0A6J4IS19_9ACTN|nr:MAG: FIG00485738: hypothetical protein [uncultured Corynebacteriales bacterium]
MRRVLFVLVTALLAVLGGTAPARASTAVVATCGATLTTDAHLTGDLSCPAGDGLTLSGSVTLDLRGFRLIGPGRDSTAIGVIVTTESSVTVRNGRIQGWGVGLGDPDQAAFTAAVRGVTFAGNGTGLVAIFDTTTVTGSRFVANTTGLTSFFAFTQVSGSTFARNGLAAGNSEGLLTITDSRLTDNPRGVSCGDGCTITRTTLRYGTTALTGGMQVVDSVIANYSRGIVSAGSFPLSDVVTVTGTRFVGNGTATAVDGYGVLTVRSSTFRDNVVGFTTLPGSEDVSVLLDGNRFTRNGDGILSTVAGVRLRANAAVRNLGWGIHAPGAVDLGGNTARGNGRSPQCVGVVCAGS